MESGNDHSIQFVGKMLEMLQDRFSPEIMHVRIDSPYYLDDPTFLVRVKLRFYCADCNQHWSTIHGTVKLRFFVEFLDINELQFKAQIFRQKCKNCQEWGEHEIHSSQKYKVAMKMGDEIDRRIYQQPNLLMRLILNRAQVEVYYFIVFISTNIGVSQLLEIPTLALRNPASSDQLFMSTLQKLNQKAISMQMEPLTEEKFERICKVVWDKYKKVLRRGGQREEEKHVKELCEACQKKTCVSGNKLPEIYHIIMDLQLPQCLAKVLIRVKILDIDIFKKYFDYDANDAESARMEESIEYLLRPYRESNELRQDFSLPDTINRIVSLFRPREPESGDEEEDEEQEEDEGNEELPQAQEREEQEQQNEEEKQQTE